MGQSQRTSMIPLLATGLTSMVGSRFQELYPDYAFENLDLSTGVDITNSDLVKQKISQSNAHALIHFAAFTNVDAANLESGDKDGPCHKINVLGTRAVAQVCATSNKYLIHISTDFVFDGKNPPPGGYTEVDTPHPIEWYGQTKLWAEEEVQKSGARYVIARITYPYRAHFPAKLDLVRKLIAKFQEKKDIPAFTNHIITPTFIDDIAVALKTFLAQKPTGIYHVVGSSPVSDFELATAIAEIFNFDKTLIKPTDLEEFLKTATRPYQKNLSTSNAKLTRDFKLPMSTLHEGLQKMKQQTEAQI